MSTVQTRDLLQYCQLPTDSAERTTAWDGLAQTRSVQGLVATLKDFHARGILTSADRQTAQLTLAGLGKLEQAVQATKADHAD